MDIKQMQKLAMLAQKKHAEFEKEIFDFSEQNGLIKGTISGKYQITLDIDFQKLLSEVEDDYETMNDMIQVAINNKIEEVKKKEKKVLGVF